jgi:CRP/FNR family transcriptional regulator, cyclic AMP receptor protein
VPSERTAESVFFSRLPPAKRVLVSRSAREVRYAAGERLFSTGDPAQGCWIIHSGHVALDTGVPGRGEVIIQTVGPGGLVGWSWLVPPYRWHFGAVALEPTSASKLDTVMLRALAEEDPKFGYTLTLVLFEAVLQRLQATRARLLDLYENPADS